MKHAIKLFALLLLGSNFVQTLTLDYFDTVFGLGKGYVTTAVGSLALINSLQIQQVNQKIVAGGHTTLQNSSQFLLMRYNVDGSLDNTFGSFAPGITTTQIGSSSSTARINSVALQSDGKILAAGYSHDTGVPTQITIARYTATGALDTINYGNGGFVQTLLGTGAFANAIAIQPIFPSNQPIVVGSTVINGTSNIFLARYTTSGSLDGSFGGTPMPGITTTLINKSCSANTVAIDSLGNIAVAGSSTDGLTSIQFTLALYSPNGSFIKSTITPLGNFSNAFCITIDSAGNFIVAGISDNAIAIARYTSSGSLDTTFGGGNGYVTTAIGKTAVAHSIVIQSDDKIVIAGNSDANLILARYSSEGILDNTFGNEGILTFSDPQNQSAAFSTCLAISSLNNDLIAAGGLRSEALVIDAVKDPTVFVTITNPSLGGLVSQRVITVNGTSSAANENVDVYIDNVFFQTVPTNSSGNWSTTILSSVLADGLHTVQADLVVSLSVVATHLNSFTIINAFHANQAAFGATLRVESVYGDNVTAKRNGSPFATINGAIEKAQSGDTIWIFPGTYNESFVIPTGVSVVGMSSNAVNISKNVAVATDLVTMGENSRIENVNLSLTSSSHVQLRGIVFPGTTSATANARDLTLTVDNSSASSVGTSNIYGIHSTGTGQPGEYISQLRASTIVVNSIGGGVKRGILVDSASSFHVRDSNIIAQGTGSGSFIGSESNNSNAVITLRTSTINGSSADISQSQGAVTVVSTDLANANANGLGFLTRIIPAILIWADPGILPLGTSFMRPGTGTSASSEVFVRVTQPLIIKQLSIQAQVAPGIGNTDTFTLRKNSIDTLLNVSLSGTAIQNISDNTSVSFTTGDLISLKIIRGLNSITQDVVLVMDAY